MMGYIQAQPAVWQHILEEAGTLAEVFAAKWQAGGLKNILLVGSGSSYNAGCVVQQAYADWTGIRLHTLPPSRAMAQVVLYDPKDTAVLFVSQSGESTNTIGIVEAVKSLGFYTVGLTEKVGSSIARTCDLFVHIDCGEETVGPKTKGFTATVLCLELLALGLGRAQGTVTQEREAQALDALRQAASAAERNIAASVAWTQAHASSMEVAPHMLIVAEGPHYPAMLEGALKVLETLYVPVMAYEFEEYLHGIQCTIDASSYIIFVIPEGQNRERMLKLYDFHAAHGGTGYVISTGEPTGLAGELFIECTGEDHTAAFETLLPLQVVSTMVSQAKGINCDVSKFPDFIKALGTKNW